MNQVIASRINWADTTIHYLRDSAVILSCLADHPARSNSYVANRVSKIHGGSTPEQWYQIVTYGDPADCTRRGLLLAQLSEFTLWCKGPKTLTSDTDNLPKLHRTHGGTECTLGTLRANEQDLVIHKLFNYTRLVCVITYCRQMLLRSKGYRSCGYLPAADRPELRAWRYGNLDRFYPRSKG